MRSQARLSVLKRTITWEIQGLPELSIKPLAETDVPSKNRGMASVTKKQREILLQQQNKADTDDKKLIGQLKAAQSQNRTVELRNKVKTGL